MIGRVLISQKNIYNPYFHRKLRDWRNVTDVKKRVVFGNEEEVLSALKLAGNSINTSYIERNNLTVRNGVSRVIRKTIDFSKRLNPQTVKNSNKQRRGYYVRSRPRIYSLLD